MSCERYQQALIDAAASIGCLPADVNFPVATSISHQASSPELREHLNLCPGCRALFTSELALFSAIDSALRDRVNPEPSPSLLPRVRASLAEQPIASRRAFPAWAYVFAGAVLLFAVFAAQNWHHSRTRPASPNGATTESSAATLLNATRSLPSPSAAQFAHSNSRPHQPAAKQGDHFQVLVDPGEDAALMRFYAATRSAPEPLPVAAQQTDAHSKPLTIAPLEIAQLGIENLDESGDVSR